MGCFKFIFIKKELNTWNFKFWVYKITGKLSQILEHLKTKNQHFYKLWELVNKRQISSIAFLWFFFVYFYLIYLFCMWMRGGCVCKISPFWVAQTINTMMKTTKFSTAVFFNPSWNISFISILFYTISLTIVGGLAYSEILEGRNTKKSNVKKYS